MPYDSMGSPSNDHRFLATMIGSDLEGLRSLAAVAGRKPTPFHGADGADALQGSARNGVQFLSVSDATGPHNEAPSSTSASSLVYLAKNVRYRMFSDLISYGKKATPNPGPGRPIRIC